MSPTQEAALVNQAGQSAPKQAVHVPIDGGAAIHCQLRRSDLLGGSGITDASRDLRGADITATSEKVDWDAFMKKEDGALSIGTATATSTIASSSSDPAAASSVVTTASIISLPAGAGARVAAAGGGAAQRRRSSLARLSCSWGSCGF